MVIKTFFISIFILFFTLNLSAAEFPWSKEYEAVLMEKIGQQIKVVSSYPTLEYPNSEYQQVINKSPNGKVLIFGYGSLINATSAARTVSAEAVKSIRPVAAFGFKRLFNYKAGNVSKYGDVEENERAMLNIIPKTTFHSTINGVVMEVTSEDLAKLVQREVGYDLVPVLVADWNDVISENPQVEVKIAYAFIVPDEIRQGIDYTQTKYYPVRGYLHLVQEGSAAFGDKFLEYWNSTTFLSDGTTSVSQWNEQTFSGILDTREP